MERSLKGRHAAVAVSGRDADPRDAQTVGGLEGVSSQLVALPAAAADPEAQSDPEPPAREA